MDDSKAMDIPIIQLRPLRDRKTSSREYQKILASIKAVGLIEPLIVYPEGEDYLILDGVQRYRALVEMGIEVVPCILGRKREAFTGNRMVNRVSPIQEHRMIEKSLEELDEQTIAAALGLSSMGHRMKKAMISRLHADVAAAFDQSKISRIGAREMSFVKPPRQREILTAMEGYKDYSVAFIRAMILKTPAPQRETRGRKRDPWDKSAQKKNDLLKKLTDVEEKHDFYARLYKQYTIDLLRLAIYARSLLTNKPVRDYLAAHHPQIVSRFEAVIAEAKG